MHRILYGEVGESHVSFEATRKRHIIFPGCGESYENIQVHMCERTLINFPEIFYPTNKGGLRFEGMKTNHDLGPMNIPRRNHGRSKKTIVL